MSFPSMIEWGPVFAFGGLEIEAEHLVIVTLYNDVVRSVGRPVSCQMRRELVESLERYALIHFAHEEDHMRRTGYPGTRVHEQSHAHFREAVRALAETVFNSIDQEIVTFLHQWLVKHILVEDRAFYNWVEQHEGLSHESNEFKSLPKPALLT